ncbi:unnamed protein product [Alopecurus aequalis]
MVREIFSYLPAKSARRFSCVSRAWHATLTSTSFVHLHLRRANKPGQVTVFFSVPDDTPEEEEPYQDDDGAEEESDDDQGDASEQKPNSDDISNLEEESADNNSEEEQEESSSSDDDDDAEEEKQESAYFYAWQPGGAARKLTPNNFCLPTPLTRPLHGLVLIRCRYTGYHVFNPCTGASLALPDTKLPAKMTCGPPYYDYIAYGLGYCSVTGAYKVVRLLSEFPHSRPTLCEVFILDTLAYWRPAAQQPPVCIVEEETPGVFLDGALHFLCRDGGIIAFDVTRETFGSLSPPPKPNNPEDAPIMMTELDGCLCVCRGDIGHGDSACHIWVLRNYKQGEWEQLCRIDSAAWTEPVRMQLESAWIAPLNMYSNDNGPAKIMFSTGTCKVFAVDVPHGNAPEILFNPDEAIGGRFEDFGEPSLGLFEESLVPVGRSIEEMVLSSAKNKTWFDILKWMPTQAVADLSLVCRAWRAMVKDDHFIRSHVAHANFNKSPRIMFVMDPTFGMFLDLQDVIDQGVGTHESTYLVCSQPCHGLNAGTFYSRSFVCNPVRGNIANFVPDGVDDDTFFAGQTGLGYDTENNTHVLVLVTYKTKNLATREYQLECKLRYVDEQKCYSVDPPPRPVANVAPTYVDGKIFWLVDPNLWPVSLNYCEIVAFNVGTAEFEVLQGPPSSSHDNEFVSILQLHGALCVACSHKSSNVIDIWMMKDVGTWKMEYHIELQEFSPEYSSEKTTPLAVDPIDGRILLSTGRSLGYYNPETTAMETIYRIDDTQWKFCPFICDESFVSTLWDARFLHEPLL